MDRPTFWEQFREDPLTLLGPLLAFGPILALAILARVLGG